MDLEENTPYFLQTSIYFLLKTGGFSGHAAMLVYHRGLEPGQLIFHPPRQSGGNRRSKMFVPTAAPKTLGMSFKKTNGPSILLSDSD